MVAQGQFVKMKGAKNSSKKDGGDGNNRQGDMYGHKKVASSTVQHQWAFPLLDIPSEPKVN